MIIALCTEDGCRQVAYPEATAESWVWVMKRFIRNVLLFVLPALVIVTAVDYLYSKAVIRSNYYDISSWYDLMHGQIDADVVVMGNSRAKVQFSPVILDSILQTTSYNLGYNGSSINRQIHKYNLFRRFNRKPRLIIQNIDYLSLQYTMGYHREQFFPYFWNSSMRKEMYNTEPISVWEKYVPMYRYYRNMNGALYLMLTDNAPTLTRGYSGVDEQWDGEALSKVKSIRFAPSDTTMTMFDEYLAQAKREGIKVVFVYSPLYIGAIKKLENMDEMRATYRQFADKYDIPILNYMDMDISHDTAYFYNAMHLNHRGAEIFSDSLANGIKRLNILR